MSIQLPDFPDEYNEAAMQIIRQIDIGELYRSIIKSGDWCSDVNFQDNPELTMRLLRASIFVMLHESLDKITQKSLLFFLIFELSDPKNSLINKVKNPKADSLKKIYDIFLHMPKV
jgi:hypothetical protein